MQFSEVFRILGNYLYYFSLILCFPLGIGIYYQFVVDPSLHPQPHCSLQFLETIFICLIMASFFKLLGRKAKDTLFRRESIILVILIWLITSVISALPFYLTGTLTNPLDAYFEAMSGLTTTGSTMISAKTYSPDGSEIKGHIENVHVPGKVYSYYGTIPPVEDPHTHVIYQGLDAVSRGILFWRSFTQWLGGMGIVVLFLTVLPALGVGGKLLYQTEVTGPVKEAISPRIQDTASLLWKLYIGLSVLEVVLLMWTNTDMPLFDAVCVTFSNLSTGGFALHNDSIATYHNAATEWIVIVFMILGSINFGLYFFIIRLKFYKLYGTDFLLFLITIVLGTALVTTYLVGTPSHQVEDPHGFYNMPEAIRAAAFQAISAQTSTGYFTANYDLWPFPSQMFMLILMFVGGMAGATCGGIKTTRIYLLFKIIRYRVKSIFRPETVTKLKFAETTIDPKGVATVMSFFCIAIFFSLLGVVLFILNGIDPETSLGLITCFINNIGIAFRAAGPLDSINFLSPFAKIISIFWMLLGRLEFFALLLLLFPGFWKGK